MDPREAGHAEFRITGVDERSLRRPQSRRAWTSIAAPVIVAVWIAGSPSAPSVSDARGNAGSDASNDPGAVVRGDRVLILADDSGSMAGEPTRIRDEQVASLRRAHDVLSDTVLTGGWAISVTNPGYSFLQPLEAALARYPDAQAVYFISDFDVDDDSGNDVQGRARLQALLRDRRLRLYLATVNKPVPATYAQLALESGGLVLSR
jgi:hypothetical protein